MWDPVLASKKSSSEGPTVAILWAEAELLKKDCFVFMVGLQLISKLPPTRRQLSSKTMLCVLSVTLSSSRMAFSIWDQWEVHELSENLCQFCICAFFQDTSHNFYQILKASVTWKRLRTTALGQILPSEVFLSPSWNLTSGSTSRGVWRVALFVTGWSMLSAVPLKPKSPPPALSVRILIRDLNDIS